MKKLKYTNYGFDELICLELTEDEYGLLSNSLRSLSTYDAFMNSPLFLQFQQKLASLVADLDQPFVELVSGPLPTACDLEILDYSLYVEKIGDEK